MKKSIIVVVAVTSEPDEGATVESALTAILSPTRREAGCVRYDLYADLRVAGGFVLIGEFTSEAALEIHDASLYLKTALAAMRELAQIKVTRLSRVDESLICATPDLS